MEFGVLCGPILFCTQSLRGADEARVRAQGAERRFSPGRQGGAGGWAKTVFTFLSPEGAPLSVQRLCPQWVQLLSPTRRPCQR